MAAAAPAQPTAAQLTTLQAKYGPGAGLAFQRSQYLAEALQSLQQSAQDNIRTPAALASNLLADGILQWGKHKADQNAQTAFSADRSNQSAQDLAAMQGPETPGPPPVTAPMASVAQASSPPPQPAPAPPSQLPMSDADRTALAQMVWGEARGEPPEGQQATAAVALNRARTSGQSLADVISAPHQFEGYNAKARAAPSADVQRILSVIAPEMAGTDPTGGATNFLNPTLQAQLGRPQPAWAQGPHQTFGHQDFYGGNPQMAQAAPQPPPIDPSTMGMGAQPFGAPQPQGPSASSPQQSPPASNPPAGAAPPPATSPGPQAEGAGPQSVPTGLPATPQEIALYQRLAADPRTYDQAHAMALDIQRRAATPNSDPSKPYWGSDGRAHYAPGTGFTDQHSGSPNTIVQRGPDNQIHLTANPAYGSVPPGMQMGPGGGVAPVQVQPKATFRIPGSPGQYVTDANGNPTKVADDNFTVKDVGQTLQDLTSSQQYDKAAKLTEMYRGMVAASTRAGGISDAELKDNAAQIFSGGVARQFNAKMLDEGQGPLLRLKQFAGEIMSGQKLSPEARQAIVTASHDYATEAQGAFGGLATSKSAFAAQNGVDLSPFIKPLMRDLPPVPAIGTIPTGSGGYNTGAPTAPGPVRPSLADIDAAIARKKAEAGQR